LPARVPNSFLSSDINTWASGLGPEFYMMMRFRIRRSVFHRVRFALARTLRKQGDERRPRMRAMGYRLPQWRWRVSQIVLAGCVAVVVSLATVDLGMAQSDAAIFPDLIQLPANFGSEGIAVGNGSFYVGSLTPPIGQILVGDLRT